MKSSVCIDAPVHEVWAVLSKLDSIHLWVSSIQHSHCPGQSRGIGAKRICELKQATIHETIVEWQEGKYFRYKGEGIPLMKSATNKWRVEANGNQTLVTSEAEVEIKGGLLGKMFEPLMKMVSARVGNQSLASLKYLIENKKPFEKSSGQLPLVSSVC